MIIEGLLTTINEDGTPHVAPMGPVVDRELANWTLRPFQTSTTFANLRRTPLSVFQTVDDVYPVVCAALGKPTGLEFEYPAEGVPVARSACRWFQLEITNWNVEQLRSEATAVVVRQADLRPFWGWNRAKHAILEATILMTRRHLIDASELGQQIESLRSAVEKTAGDRELAAWNVILAELNGES